MSNVFYLTNIPCDRDLDVRSRAHFSWDGKEKLILSLQGGYKTSMLHFHPGDAFRASQEGNVVKLRKLEPPHTLSGVVLWTYHAEKDARVTDSEAFSRRVEQFRSTHRTLDTEPDFSPIWKPQHRTKKNKCTGPFLFIINEEKLRIARYAKHKGTMWVTVAAYCDPGISVEEATDLIRKHGIIEAPKWYIRNAIHKVCNGDVGEPFLS